MIEAFRQAIGLADQWADVVGAGVGVLLSLGLYGLVRSVAEDE